MQQSFAAICRRAGGRRRYNKQRHLQMLLRRLCILLELSQTGIRRGTLSALARRWGVHRATIQRDVHAVFPTARARGTPEEP